MLVVWCTALLFVPGVLSHYAPAPFMPNYPSPMFPGAIGGPPFGQRPPLIFQPNPPNILPPPKITNCRVCRICCQANMPPQPQGPNIYHPFIRRQQPCCPCPAPCHGPAPQPMPAPFPPMPFPAPGPGPMPPMPPPPPPPPRMPMPMAPMPPMPFSPPTPCNRVVVGPGPPKPCSQPSGPIYQPPMPGTSPELPARDVYGPPPPPYVQAPTYQTPRPPTYQTPPPPTYQTPPPPTYQTPPPPTYQASPTVTVPYATPTQTYGTSPPFTYATPQAPSVTASYVVPTDPPAYSAPPSYVAPKYPVPGPQPQPPTFDVPRPYTPSPNPYPPQTYSPDKPNPFTPRPGPLINQPQSKGCCFVTLQPVQAVVSCGEYGKCCAGGDCSNARNMTVTIATNNFTPNIRLTCEEAVQRGFIPASTISGFCTTYVPFDGPYSYTGRPDDWPSSTPLPFDGSTIGNVRDPNSYASSNYDPNATTTVSTVSAFLALLLSTLFFC